MKKTIAVFLVAVLAAVFAAGPAFAGKFWSPGKVATVDQYNSQFALQGQFSTGGLSVQRNSGAAEMAYKLKNGGIRSTGITGTSYGQSQLRLGSGLNIQGGVYGSTQGAATYVGPPMMP